MSTELLVIAAAGFAAGLGVAMPLGAIAVLILREGMLHGFRTAVTAATAVAFVDLLYCAVAVAVGATLAPQVSSWGAMPRYISGAVLIAIGAYQLWRARQSSPLAAGGESGGAWGEPARSAVFFRFLALTAVNPLTLVYFFALAGIVTTTAENTLAPLLFVAAAGIASLLWQTGLAVIGAAFRATISPRTADRLGLIASALIIGFGVAVAASASS